MKAIVYDRYGTPEYLRMQEVPRPIPKDDEVLVQVNAVSVNGSDWEGLTGKPFYARLSGLWRPRQKILGSDIAGVIEKTGKNIHDFKAGDEVFGEIPGYHGGFAEYACTPERTLALKPASLSFEQAAAIPQGGTIAYQGIVVKGKVQPGQLVLVNGAGGSAGVFALQLAKLCGAEVTGVDNASKLELMRSLGADHVIDYTQQDFTQNGNQYDLVLDVIARRSPSTCLRALKPGGTYYIVGGYVRVLLQFLLLGPRIKKQTGKTISILAVPQNRDDLLEITQLCETGKILPVIDRCYPLDQTPEALHRVGEGRAQGKVVIIIKER
jgi:NADPH:quinone reductase-like Zn-dependent oxidoreductase